MAMIFLIRQLEKQFSITVQKNILNTPARGLFLISLMIKSENAYGGYSSEAVIEIPKSVFEEDGPADEELLREGNYLTLEDHNGNPLRGRVQKVEDDKVTMDFNHPLAGQDLHFKGGIVDVREATESELAHGHVHGAGGHHH